MEVAIVVSFFISILNYPQLWPNLSTLIVRALPDPNSFFSLKCKTGRALGKMIKTVSTLEELNLEDNEIGEEGATAIALGIQCETAKLKSLNISQNIIGDNGGIGTYLKCMLNRYWRLR